MSQSFVEEVKSLPRTLWKIWDGFFFSQVSTVPIGVFRFVFGLNIFLMYALRATSWRYYFTNAGPIPTESALDIIPEFYRPEIHWFPTTDAGMFAFQAVFLIVLALLTLGVFGRVMAVIAFFMHVAFIQRNYSVAYGADFIATFFLFALMLTDNSRSMSVLSLFRSSESKPIRVGSLSQMLSTIGMRLVQIQLCVIYAYTGLEKMKGTSWWEGSAIWSVMGNRQLVMFDTSFLTRVPLVIAVLTFSTVMFEVYFAVLVWIKPIRKWLLLFGTGMHVMIAFTIGLWFFSFGMIAAYVVFLDPAWLKATLMRLRVPRRVIA